MTGREATRRSLLFMGWRPSKKRPSKIRSTNFVVLILDRFSGKGDEALPYMLFRQVGKRDLLPNCAFLTKTGGARRAFPAVRLSFRSVKVRRTVTGPPQAVDEVPRHYALRKSDLFREELQFSQFYHAVSLPSRPRRAGGERSKKRRPANGCLF